MKYINIAQGPQQVPAIILGCMRMPALTVDAAEEMLHTSMELGVNFYDNATCYSDGVAETRFGDALRQSGIDREKIIIQTKCGIVKARQEFDWTKENILTSVDESLQRMQIDYLDILLLHRPDLIFEPEQVAEAFDILESSGKVKYFGMSNLSSMQIELLKKYVKQPLIINQLQLSLEQSQLIDQAFYINNLTTDRSISRDSGLLDYCRLHDITIQTWSPLQHGFFQGTFVDHPDFPELNEALGELAETWHVSKTAIAIAWILRHPARMQAIAGTMNPSHLRDLCDAVKVELSHQDWYKLYLASGKFLP